MNEKPIEMKINEKSQKKSQIIEKENLKNEESFKTTLIDLIKDNEENTPKRKRNLEKEL
jgi:hypothetical protein